MNAKLYQLANNIKSEYHTSFDSSVPALNEHEIERYSKTVLARIRNGSCQTPAETKEDRAADRKHDTKTVSFGKRFVRRTFKFAAAAACMAFVLGVTVFSEDVHAAVRHISWSLGSALGLPGDLADYRDIINTSITDNGYCITLQEVIAADEKIVINYTIQREDGESMGEIPASPNSDLLYINGKNVTNTVSGGSGYLDDERTVIGISKAFDVPGVDMTKESTYQLRLNDLYDYNLDTKIRGKWHFSFSADGSDLIADTVTIPLNRTFAIADGITVTLDNLTLNELEQRITYHTEGSSGYLLQLTATDPSGRQAQFDTKIQDAEGSGYMQNQEILCDGRIDESAGTVTMVLYAVKMPEQSGRMSNDYQQVGEAFEVKIND